MLSRQTRIPRTKKKHHETPHILNYISLFPFSFEQSNALSQKKENYLNPIASVSCEYFNFFVHVPTSFLSIFFPYHLFSFSEPNFVGSFDIGDYVFFFFRETAVEYINCGKSVYSRVARVCKRDTGGKNILSQNWATYLKARLNCSIPGEFPFYFNEIRKYISQVRLIL